jgi:hypothetical protein
LDEEWRRIRQHIASLEDEHVRRADRARALREVDAASWVDISERKEQRRAIALQIYEVVRRHGTPLHWSVIRTMTADRFTPPLGPVETYRALSDYRDLFERVGPGVYQARERAI